MNRDLEQYQLGPAAAVAGVGDVDNDDDDDDDDIEEQPQDTDADTGSDTHNVDKEDDDDDDDDDEDGNKAIDVEESSEEDAIREDLVWFSMANEGLQEELRVTKLEVAHLKLELEANAGLQEELRVANSEIAHLQFELEEKDERMMTMHQQLELEEEDEDDANENNSDIDDENDAEVDAAVNRLLYKLFDRMYNGTLRGDTNVALAGKVGSIVLKRKDFPYLQRKKIPTLVTEFFQNLDRHEQGLDRDYTIAIPLEKFLYDLRYNIEDMLCDQSHGDAGYCGLDSNRDTEKEVITAIRFFPETLTHVGGFWGDYPIACVQLLWDEDGYGEPTRSNTKAVFFVHVLAKLAIEYNSFEEDLRGGLLDHDAHGDDDAPDDASESSKILNLLVRSQNGGDEAYHRNADTVFLEELMRLYQMDLFKKEDIQRCDLLTETLGWVYFEERRFRFLVQLDPYSLMHVSPADNGDLPLHVAAPRSAYKSMKRFRSVFDAGMRYFPYQNGIALLFRKNRYQSGKTPFQYACGDKNERRQEVMDVVEDTISRYSETTPINTEDALILAATNNAIHLDCVFFLLKRQPDVLLSLLRQQSQQPQTNTDSTKNNSKRRRSTRKSKRKRN